MTQSGFLQIKLSTTWLVLVLILALISVLFLWFISKNSIVESFLYIERRDPLFDFSGASPEELKQIAEFVNKANQTIKTTLPENLKKRDLYPYEFWLSLSNTAELRNKFLDKPGWLEAFRLFYSQSLALKHYRNDFNEYLALWDAALKTSQIPMKDDTAFVFLPGVATDIRTMKTALGKIEDNIRALDKDLESRRNCLFFGICQEMLASTKIISQESAKASSGDGTPEEEFLPVEHLSFSQRALLATPLDERLFLVKTGCFGKTSKEQSFFLWQRDYGNMGSAFYPKLVTNSFFKKIDETQPLPQDVVLLQAGIKYAWQPETNLYMCPDVSYYLTLASMIEVLKRVEKMNVIEQLSAFLPPKILNELSQAEEELKNSEIISVPQMNYFINLLYNAEDSLDSGSYLELEKEIHNLVRTWHTRTGKLIDIMAILPVETTRYVKISEQLGKTPTLVSTSLSRSFISILYAGWNQSVWRLNQELKFIGTNRNIQEESSQRFKTYWELSKELTEEKIREIQTLSIQDSYLPTTQ